MIEVTVDRVTSWVDQNVLQSVSPATTDFGFSYFSLLIPPFKPKSVLILGYGRGSLAKLIRRVWNTGRYGMLIHGVDLESPPEGTMDRVTISDALTDHSITSYIAEQYDYVVVDLFKGSSVPGEVLSSSFLKFVADHTGRCAAFNLTALEEDDTYRFVPYFTVIAKKSIGANRIYFLKPKR